MVDLLLNQSNFERRMDINMSPRSIFEHELAQLQEQIEEISQMVETAYRDLFEALEIKDKKTVENIVKNDHNVNELKRQIESQCLRLIMKQQPVASDLRTITSVLKMVSDIERIGDNVSDIAELLLRMELKKFADYSTHLDNMVVAAKELFIKAVDVFVNNDCTNAEKVIADDDIVDMLFNKVKNDVIEGLKSEHYNADEYIDIMMIAKYLEKIGDHAVNIAEWQIFKETGDISSIS